jgi:hypothetical protein
MKRSGIQTGILMIASKMLMELMQIKYLFYDVKTMFEFTILLLESAPERAYPDRDLISV